MKYLQTFTDDSFRTVMNFHLKLQYQPSRSLIWWLQDFFVLLGQRLTLPISMFERRRVCVDSCQAVIV